ncbi:hypothetical protein [Nigerium massiliense]|uniref:hypothetical protein n=1 Tax=Nigerium massiliense TaxID=1522317 RepID=UPI00058DDE02|nr:hypothetical protein [Nigerium massiliense]
MRKIIAAPAVAAALLVVGCTQTGANTPGGNPAPADPKEALAQAATNTGQGKDLTSTFRFDTTQEDLTKAMDAMNSTASASPSSSSNKQMQTTLAKVLPKLTMKVSMHSRGAELNHEKDPANLDGAFQLAVDGKAVDLTWLEKRAFAKADVDGIGQATGLFTGDQVRMAANDQASSKPWITPLIDGKWVELDSESVQKALQQAQASASPQATPTTDPAKVQAAFMDNSEVTKVDDDTYKVVTDAKKLLPALAAVDPNDKFTDEQAQDAVKKIKDGANLDTTVDLADGKISRVVVDLDDVARTWPVTDGDASATKLAATDFHLDGVLEFNEDNPNLTAPQPEATIPASDLQQLGGGTGR